MTATDLPEPPTLVDRSYYSASIAAFLASDIDAVLGHLTARSEFDVDLPQRDAWRAEIACLRCALAPADPDDHRSGLGGVPRARGCRDCTPSPT